MTKEKFEVFFSDDFVLDRYKSWANNNSFIFDINFNKLLNPEIKKLKDWEINFKETPCLLIDKDKPEIVDILAEHGFINTDIDKNINI